jgi:hypothetical protein
VCEEGRKRESAQDSILREDSVTELGRECRVARAAEHFGCEEAKKESRRRRWRGSGRRRRRGEAWWEEKRSRSENEPAD